MSKYIGFEYHLASEEDWSEEIPDCRADDRPMDERTEIVVEFSYPLRRSVRRTLKSDAGFTRLLFAQSVAHEYEKIYEEEESSRTKSPEPQGMLLNRSETDGIHGIWGHGLSDLVLEGATLKDGVWHLNIGS